MKSNRQIFFNEMAPSFLSLSALFFACLATCSVAATAKTGRALRQGEPAPDLDEASSVMTTDSSEIKLVSSMEVLLHSKDQDEDPDSPKSETQRKLVALIWLERVLQQNLDSMDEETFEAKIAANKDKLAKDSSPATAAMLGQMRTEMHQFAVPFYQNAVKEEMKRLRARQKVLLGELIKEDAQEGDSSQKADEPAPEQKQTEEKKQEDKKKKEKDDSDKKARKDRSDLFVGIMSGIAGLLLCFVCTVACVVRNHVGPA